MTVADSVLENITPNIFKNVKNIKILNVFNCSFEFDRQLAIFNKLEKLETLAIQNTHFEVENVTLQGLRNLKRLELFNNSLSSIEKDGLNDLVNLEKLEIVNNHVMHLEELRLCELKKLKYLRVKNNMLTSLKSFYFFCLRNRQSIDFSINSQPALPNIYQASFFNITTVAYDLIELDLSFNQIVDLGYSLEDLEELRILNFGYNKLVSIKFVHFKSLIKLQKLNLTNNELRSIDNRVFINKTQLNSVDLSHNFLTTFVVSNISQLQYLDLAHNNISTISFKNLKNLKKLNLMINRLTKLEANAFQEVPNLIYLNLAGNNLDLTLGLFKNMQVLKYLYLSNNSLNSIPEKVFLGLKNLRVLDLSFNHLEIINKNTFHDLENLEILNLSSNAIESLSYLAVEPLKNLRYLDIAANKLSYIEYDVILSKLPVLSNMNIKSNQLTCDNLGKIIAFLKEHHILYTNSEHLDANKLNQNVAGIPCRAATANRLLVAVESEPKRNVTLFNFGIFVIVVLVSILTAIVTYRFYIYLKRRRYRADEFELVLE